MAKPKSHKDVEFMVAPADGGGGESYFKTFDDAAARAVSLAVSGRKVYLDVLVSSRAGARWVGGDHGVEQYDEDPEASVYERVEIRAESRGRIA